MKMIRYTQGKGGINLIAENDAEVRLLAELSERQETEETTRGYQRTTIYRVEASGRRWCVNPQCSAHGKVVRKGETMQPHQERVVNELKELTEKRERLALFMGGGVFIGLPDPEQDRLHRQFNIMVQYEGVLQERIDHFPR